jgi:Protein of unknown function (DUF1566)
MKLMRTFQIGQFGGLLTFGLVLALAGCGGGRSEPTPDWPSPLNDTGRIACSGFDEASAVSPCPVSGAQGQDAEFGRDALAKRGKLLKVGGGDGGFDFSKLGSDGMPLLLQDRLWRDDGVESEGSFWSCVLDNTTGLTWEIKRTDPTHPRYSLSTYNWYSGDMATNGGIAGTPNQGECNTARCDTEGYVDYVNSIALCGYRNWRLPTATEFYSIGHLGRENPALDIAYFPDTLGALRYWTADTSAAFAQNAWYMYFSDASMSYTSKNNKSYVRLVRSE